MKQNEESHGLSSPNRSEPQLAGPYLDRPILHPPATQDYPTRWRRRHDRPTTSPHYLISVRLTRSPVILGMTAEISTSMQARPAALPPIRCDAEDSALRTLIRLRAQD